MRHGPRAVRVVRLPGRVTAAAGVYVVGGSALDPPGLAGACHLIEHLTLRRCADRRRLDIARLVDRLGGGVDAWTSTEAMGLVAHTTRDGLGEALALLRDAALEPTFAPEDVELERRVALAELELERDSPETVADEALLAAAWGDHPYARPVVGTAESLARLDPEALRRHHRRLLRPGSVLAVAVGDVDPAVVETGLGGLPLGQRAAPPPLDPPGWLGRRVAVRREGLEQAHVRVAFPAPGVESAARADLVLLDRVLGAGQASRLYQRLREELGLVYDIATGLVLHRGAGLVEIAWACSPDAVRAVWGEVMAVLRRCREEGFGEEEVETARRGLLRSLEMDEEDPPARLGLEAGWLLDRGRPYDPELARRELAAVTAERVRRLAEAVLRPEVAASAVCGPDGVAELVA